MTGGNVRRIEYASLAALNTFGIAATAPLLLELDHARHLPDAFDELDGPPLVLGGGSNMLFVAAPEAPVLRVCDVSLEVVADHADEVIVRAGAGLSWHALVMRSLDMGLAGLENLALIPGTAGAAPIQNIGAYGVEVASRIAAVHAYEPGTGEWHRLDAEACGFGYRDSLFKHEPDRFVIGAVDYRLHRVPRLVLGYAGLGDALAARGVSDPTARDVAEAVIAIRRSKLPDPAVLGNAGSFFKNPVLPEAEAEALAAAHPGLPVFAAGDGQRKLSAAWLIDRAGYKGLRRGAAGVSPGHALVLVNHGGASGRDVFDVALEVATGVRQRFGVALEPEPRIVGAAWPDAQ